MNDSISRKAAIDALCDNCDDVQAVCAHYPCKRYIAIEKLPSAQPEVRPIDYQDCSNAMLKMWIDNVVTGGEYNRIMDKLNAHWGKEK